MKKEIELFDINLEVVAGEETDMYFNNESVDITSDEYNELRKMSTEQYELLSKIENINEKAKKMIFLKQAESILSINDIKGLLDRHYLAIDMNHIEHSGASHDIKRRRTSISFYDNKAEAFQQLICTPENLKL